jgi:hypothetical protein
MGEARIGMYRARFRQDEVNGLVGWSRLDNLALHNYRPDAARAVDALIAGTVETLKAYGGTTRTGAPRHQVWVNELGRPTELDDPSCGRGCGARRPTTPTRVPSPPGTPTPRAAGWPTWSGCPPSARRGTFRRAAGRCRRP